MTDKPCEYCGTTLPAGVDKQTRQIRSFHFESCEARKEQASAALAEQTVKESLTTRPSIIDSIADNLIGDHIALMNENWMLRAALAEQEAEQKPAAWIREDTAITTDAYQASCWRDAHTVTPLYTTPLRREWQGLTERERLDIRTEWNCRPQRSYADLMDMTAAALKWKNA